MSTAVISNIYTSRNLTHALRRDRSSVLAPDPAVDAATNAATNAAAKPVALAAPRLRITRRGQLVLTVVVAIPVVCAAFAIAINGGGATATGSAGSHDFQHVTVEAGETLWHLAGKIAPGVDPRIVVSDIAELNQLDNATVQPGQSIAIPQQYSR